MSKALAHLCLLRWRPCRRLLVLPDLLLTPAAPAVFLRHRVVQIFGELFLRPHAVVVCHLTRWDSCLLLASRKVSAVTCEALECDTRYFQLLGSNLHCNAGICFCDGTALPQVLL